MNEIEISKMMSSVENRITGAKCTDCRLSCGWERGNETL